MPLYFVCFFFWMERGIAVLTSSHRFVAFGPSPSRMNRIATHRMGPIDAVQFKVQTACIANHFTAQISPPNRCRQGAAIRAWHVPGLLLLSTVRIIGRGCCCGRWTVAIVARWMMIVVGWCRGLCSRRTRPLAVSVITGSDSSTRRWSVEMIERCFAGAGLLASSTAAAAVVVAVVVAAARGTSGRFAVSFLCIGFVL